MWDHSKTQISSLYVSKTALDEGFLPIYPLGLFDLEDLSSKREKVRPVGGHGAKRKYNNQKKVPKNLTNK
jgi:hypothetical protein